jgi:hypothetical protein
MITPSFPIVPIVYMGGTGAGILSYLIHAALSDRDPTNEPPLTYYGSSHLIWPRFLVPFAEVHIPPEKQIEHMLNIDLDFNFNEPRVYTTPVSMAMHCTDIDLLMRYVDRTILITYTTDDILEIAKVFLGKRFIDGFYFPDGTKFYIERDNTIELVKEYKTQLDNIIKFQSSFVPRYDYGDRILNLSWEELVHTDPTISLKKLSEFTAVDINKFDMKTFIEWQKRTIFCIQDLEEFVQTEVHSM